MTAISAVVVGINLIQHLLVRAIKLPVVIMFTLPNIVATMNVNIAVINRVLQVEDLVIKVRPATMFMNKAV